MGHVTDLIDALPESRREEARRLDALFREVTGWTPWSAGRNLVGYGRYAYHYDSGRTGGSFATGFAMRSRDIALHIMPGYAEFPEVAARLGPHKRGKSCWYIGDLDAVDEAALRDLVRVGLDDLARQWPVSPT